MARWDDGTNGLSRRERKGGSEDGGRWRDVVNAEAVRPAREAGRIIAAEKNYQNKAGMLLIQNHFHFWNQPKAGMFVKTSQLREKAGMSFINKQVSIFQVERTVINIMKTSLLSRIRRNVHDMKQVS
jgi:hypothetical protein